MYDTYDCVMAPILYALNMGISSYVYHVDFLTSVNDLYFVF